MGGRPMETYWKMYHAFRFSAHAPQCVNVDDSIAKCTTLGIHPHRIVRHKRGVTEGIYMSKYFVWFMDSLIFRGTMVTMKPILKKPFFEN